jgi:hypothetical protein
MFSWTKFTAFYEQRRSIGVVFQLRGSSRIRIARPYKRKLGFVNFILPLLEILVPATAAVSG